MKKKGQISIIGCGWLGMPLAQQFVAKGYTVKGSTTSATKLETIKQNGITPYLIQLSEKKISEAAAPFLEGSETLIINIPPGLRQNPNKNHVNEIKYLIKYIETQGVKNVLYISSTSVYNDGLNMPIITETTETNPSTESGKQLIAIEQILKSNKSFKTTILRFSGLFDNNRHPAHAISKKQNTTNPEAPVNLIHKNDCISIIIQLIENNLWQHTLNASNPLHPSKKTYYTSYCKTHNLPLPQFDTNKPSKGKIVDVSKLVQLLKYTFKTGL